MIDDPSRSRFSLNGVLAMSLDWVPGVGFAIAGSFLSWWRSSIVAQERLNSLDARLAKHERSQELLEGSVHGEISEAIEQLQNLTTSVKVLTAEQAVINRISTSTLEGIVGRLERLDSITREHDRQIAAVRSAQ